MKQETLEKDLIFPLIIENGMDYLNLTTKIYNNGAKWKAERMYSEEEVEGIVHKTIDKFCPSFSKDLKQKLGKEWFEQFKKN